MNKTEAAIGEYLSVSQAAVVIWIGGRLHRGLIGVASRRYGGALGANHYGDAATRRCITMTITATVAIDRRAGSVIRLLRMGQRGYRYGQYK